METLPSEASAFWITWNIGPEHSALRPRIQRGTCRLRFSFFANDFDLRSRAASALGLALREGAAQAATANVLVEELAALRDLRLDGESRWRSLRACSSVG